MCSWVSPLALVVFFLFQTSSLASQALALVPSVLLTSLRSNINNINTIVGTGAATSSSAGAAGTSTSIKAPRTVFEDSLGYLYFTDDVCVRKASLSAMIVIDVAGVCGSTGSNSGDGGPSTSAHMNAVNGVVVDTQGNVYMADSSN